MFSLRNRYSKDSQFNEVVLKVAFKLGRKIHDLFWFLIRCLIRIIMSRVYRSQNEKEAMFHRHDKHQCTYFH